MAFCDGTFLPPMPVAEGHNQSYSCETPGGVAMSSIASSLPGRMNVFQKLMYQWSELHPYNAVHIYRIAGGLDPRRLLASIAQAYRHNGLGAVEIAANGQSYRHCSPRHRSWKSSRVATIRTEADAAQVGAGLNRPFSRPCCQPWRFSAVSDGPKSFYLLLIYDHWIADSVAARLVVQQVLRRDFGLGARRESRPLDLYPATYRKVFCAAARAVAVGCRGDAPAVQRDPQSGSAAGCLLVGHADGGQFRAVRHRARHGGPFAEFARQTGATVNDVIQAALARAMAPVVPRRAKGADRRTWRSATSSTCGAMPPRISRTRWARLSYYNVRCRPEESDDLADLARRVAGSTGPLKARHGYLDAVVNMQFVSRLWPHFSAATKARFMKRAIPLTAGVSNIYFRDVLLDHELDGRIIGYIRAASTGPILPLVITPTTINGQLNVGVTYRQTGFSLREDRSRDGSIPGGNRVSGPVGARPAWRRTPAARTARDKRRRVTAWRAVARQRRRSGALGFDRARCRAQKPGRMNNLPRKRE